MKRSPSHCFPGTTFNNFEGEEEALFSILSSHVPLHPMLLLMMKSSTTMTDVFCREACKGWFTSSCAFFQQDFQLLFQQARHHMDSIFYHLGQAPLKSIFLHFWGRLHVIGFICPFGKLQYKVHIFTILGRNKASYIVAQQISKAQLFMLGGMLLAVIPFLGKLLNIWHILAVWGKHKTSVILALF